MFRKPKKSKATFRKRAKAKASTNSDDEDEENNQKTFRKSYRKKDDSSDEEANGATGEEGGRGEDTSSLLEQIRKDRNINSKKRRLGGGGGGGASDDEENDNSKKRIMHQYEISDKRMTAAEMATRTAEYHPTEINPGASKPNESATNKEEEEKEGDEKIYKGNQKTRNKFLAGPMKAPTFVRTTCRFDYQPDICKDYKDTGFCGYGDTCIYLHDRGDTLTGWQLEKQWEDQKKKEREAKEKEMDKFIKYTGDAGDDYNDDDDDGDSSKMLDDGIPFACHICRGAFNDPVVTSCGHYFCEKCIMERVKSSTADMQACPICGKDTHGVFNHPTKLVAKKRRAVGRDGSWEDYFEAARRGK